MMKPLKRQFCYRYWVKMDLVDTLVTEFRKEFRKALSICVIKHSWYEMFPSFYGRSMAFRR